MGTIHDRGKEGEQLAEAEVVRRGFEILKRRYYCRYGEIDLIVRKGTMLCFLEVKTRKSFLLGSPAESVSSFKMEKIFKAAQHFLQHFNGPAYDSLRFDLITLTWQDNDYKLEWQEGIAN